MGLTDLARGREPGAGAIEVECMVQAQIEIVLIAAVVAASCALVGAFLVLRRMALMSDAISHAILFGIVLAFFVVESTSPLP